MPYSRNWELSLIDAGLVASLGPLDRQNFIDLFSAVVRNDGERVGKLIIERSRGGGSMCVDPEGFSRAIGDLVSEVHGSGLALGRIGVGALLQKVLLLCYQYRVKLEPRFSSVVIAVGVLEGLGRRLDPNVDILKIAAPYVLKASL
jgi:aarF domain-containing kinase